MNEEPEAIKNVQKYIKKNGAKSFCENFLITLANWRTLETYCVAGEFYKCSPEIQSYSMTRQKMFDLLGEGIRKSLDAETVCN